MKYLLNVVETYRVDSESEADNLIAEAKADSSFTLAKYDREYKEKKSKGDIVDKAYVVKLTKKYYDSLWDVE